MLKTCRTRWGLGVLAAALALAACAPPPPIQIGFVGGLTDRNADNGQAGYNAVLLAVEAFNRAGGVNGRLVEVLSKDDAQDKATAERVAKELVAARVAAVIGPFTSGMAKAIVPITDAAGVFEVSPTITSMDFYGVDDNLFRINRTTRDNANEYARVMLAQGMTRVAVAYDVRNRNFSESWLREFEQAMQRQGHPLAGTVAYESSDHADFAGVVKQLLAPSPNALFFISGALDVARLAQQARRQAPGVALGAAEWAGTEQLLDLGGEVVEGLLVAQNFDRDDPSPRYKAFSDAYQQRFQRLPGYSSVAAFDAATVVLEALKAQREGESLKQAALRAGPYVGLQQTIAFDANGDTWRRVVFTRIQGGRYVKLPQTN